MVRYARGQLWWCKQFDVKNIPKDFNAIYENVQKGNRPVLIVSNNIGNKKSEIVQVVPLTTSEKTKLPTHTIINFGGKMNTIMCEQLKTVNKNTLYSYIGMLEEKELKEVELALAVSLGLDLVEAEPTELEIPEYLVTKKDN